MAPVPYRPEGVVSVAYVGHDDIQYLYAEYVAAALEAQQAHRDSLGTNGAWLEKSHGTLRYWWASSNLAAAYRGKLRYGPDGKPRDLSTLDQWKIHVPEGD